MATTQCTVKGVEVQLVETELVRKKPYPSFGGRKVVLVAQRSLLLQQSGRRE